MTHRLIDPDRMRRDDAAYWAVAIIVAIRAGDYEREELARQNLARLGYRLATLRGKRRKGVRDGR